MRFRGEQDEPLVDAFDVHRDLDFIRDLARDAQRVGACDAGLLEEDAIRQGVHHLEAVRLRDFAGLRHASTTIALDGLVDFGAAEACVAVAEVPEADDAERLVLRPDGARFEESVFVDLGHRYTVGRWPNFVKRISEPSIS